MAVPIDENVLNALRGQASITTRLPKPLLIKVYISSLKEEFSQERRMLLELVGPELQSIYDDRQIEIEIVDMHFGTGSVDVCQAERDPYILRDYLHEIETCHNNSKSVFFLSLIGDGIGRMPLPTHIDEDIYRAIKSWTDSADDVRQLLGKWYAKQQENELDNQATNYSIWENGSDFTGSGSGREAARCRIQYVLKQEYRFLPYDNWLHENRRMRDHLEKCFEKLTSIETSKDCGFDDDFIKRLQQLRSTQIELEVTRALELSNDRILAVFRQWSAQLSKTDTDANERLSKLKDQLTMHLSADNYTTLAVPGKCDDHSINPDNEDHENYLSKFKNKVTDKLRFLIEEHIANDPDVIKGRRKTVQEIFHEHSTHMRILREHQIASSLISSSVPMRIREKLFDSRNENPKHPPYFITGPHGSGKSTLLVELYRLMPEWFGSSRRVHRIIRFASSTPRSAYNLELLRVICQQISIIFNIPEGYLPKDASFDPIYINNWFQRLVQRVEDMSNDLLFIFIDDLHVLNQIDCDVVTALSWLPAWLPRNLQIVCATAIPIDQLKIIPNQRELFKSAQFDLRLPQNQTLIQRPNGVPISVTFEQFIEREFNRLEQIYGIKGFSRLASYLTLTQYGLTETELLELLMPTDNPEALVETTNGGFNFSTFKRIHIQMAHLVRDKIMSGKVLIQWRHPYCGQLSRTRYVDMPSTRQMHIDISNIFFQPEQEENEEESSKNDTEQSEDKQSVASQRERDSASAGRKSSSHHNDDSSTFYNPIAADVSYSVRHVEESWHHLMRSDDTDRFKQIAVCNFDFLLAAVQTVSISYLRCLIEHVRCYLLDRDIELIYNTIRKSSDVLTRDPMQLGAQLISWLRPISEHDENDNSLLSITVRQATAWCDGYTVPLLVPLTGWLPVPLPSQIRTMTVPGTGPVRDVCVSPTKQHIILATNWGDVQLWHIMSNSLEYTFKGHTAAVTCTAVATQSDVLLTGSEDSTVMVWNVTSRELRAHIKSHAAAVTSVAVGANNSLAISSSDDSTIVISDIYTGIMLHKITYHRGAVKSIKVCGACDVLISSSVDKMICLWSLEDYSLLNSMQMCSPVLRIDISSDSVFLLALCEDNNLYVRTLATGKELHILKGHKAKVCSIGIAKDNRRAVVGCLDLRAAVYDMHSGRLVRWMPPSPGAVTAVYTMENDDFLIIVGGNKITFYSFRNEEIPAHPYSHNQRRKRSLKRSSIQSQRSPSTSLPPITCFDISRDSQLVAIASGRSIHIIKINTPEYQTSFEGHNATVTCLNFAPNGEFLASGSEDRLVHVWNVAIGQILHTFKGHNAAVICLVVLMDSRRIITSDIEGIMYVWLAEGGNVLQTIQAHCKHLAVTNNMKFTVSLNGDNAAKIWSLTREDEKYTVTHVEEITCFTITADSLYVITGSKDNSLKVWQATGGKLAQVLVGHSDTVTCVAVSVTNKTQVISGSRDTILFIWDLHTGGEIHTLAGHLGAVIGVKVSADGSTAVSASEDKTLIVWETKRGLALTSLQLHVPFTNFDISLECSRILVQLVDSFNLPVICLHNTPAQYVKLPTYSAPALDVEDLRPLGPKRQMKRLLKKEVSLDTYTWQKKYGHLTSSVMMAQVDERLKRRFSVSASMEEISKVAEMKTMTSQTNLGPEQAALAQSQHFDQLEALWNKRSPPRRRHNAGLSRQTSLVEDRLESSDDDEFHDERTGMLNCNNYAYASFGHLHCLALSPRMPKKIRPNSLPLHAACVASSFYVQMFNPIECPQQSPATTPKLKTKSKSKTKTKTNSNSNSNLNSNSNSHTNVNTNVNVYSNASTHKILCASSNVNTITKTEATTTPQPITSTRTMASSTRITTPNSTSKPTPAQTIAKTSAAAAATNNTTTTKTPTNTKNIINNSNQSQRRSPIDTRRPPPGAIYQPDLVKDLMFDPSNNSPENASPTRRQIFGNFFRSRRHIKTSPKEVQKIEIRPRATPIIIVENCDNLVIQTIQTHTVLHPRPACAAWGIASTENEEADGKLTPTHADDKGTVSSSPHHNNHFHHHGVSNILRRIFRRKQQQPQDGKKD